MFEDVEKLLFLFASAKAKGSFTEEMSGEEISKEALSLLEEKDILSANLEKLLQQIEKLRPWGNFDFAEVKKLEEKKKTEADNAKEEAVVAKIVENATMEIPDAMLDTQVRQMVNDFAQRLQMQGLSFEQYMQFTGATVEQLMEQVKPQAEKRIKSRLVLEAVAKAENIEVSDSMNTYFELNFQVQKEKNGIPYSC